MPDEAGVYLDEVREQLEKFLKKNPDLEFDLGWQHHTLYRAIGISEDDIKKLLSGGSRKATEGDTNLSSWTYDYSAAKNFLFEQIIGVDEDDDFDDIRFYAILKKDIRFDDRIVSLDDENIGKRREAELICKNITVHLVDVFE